MRAAACAYARRAGLLLAGIGAVSSFFCFCCSCSTPARSEPSRADATRVCRPVSLARQPSAHAPERSYYEQPDRQLGITNCSSARPDNTRHFSRAPERRQRAAQSILPRHAELKVVFAAGERAAAAMSSRMMPPPGSTLKPVLTTKRASQDSVSRRRAARLQHTAALLLRGVTLWLC